MTGTDLTPLKTAKLSKCIMFHFQPIFRSDPPFDLQCNCRQMATVTAWLHANTL